MKTYPLSQSQMGILLEMMQYPQITQYNLRYTVSFPKTIDLDRLERAVKTIYASRPEWRIRFLMEGDEPRQTVDDSRELKVTRLVMTEAQCEAYLKEPMKPFDPFNDILCHFQFVETPERILSISDFSHLISDGLSIALLFAKRDIPLAYDGKPLPEQSYGMLSWAEDEDATFHTSFYEKDKAYYLEHFQGCEALSLADAVSEPVGRAIRSDEYLPMAEVDEWCKQHGTAPNLLLMAAFAYTLSVAGRVDNFVFNTFYHGRTERRIREVFGMFVRTVPVRATVSPDTKVIDFIRSFRAELMGTIRHGSYPFTHFCRDLKIKPDISFAYQNDEITEDVLLDGTYYPCHIAEPDAICGEPTLYVFGRNGQYDLRVISSDKLNSLSFLQTLAHSIKTVVQQMMQQPDAALSSLSLVDEEEQAALITLGQGEKIAYNETETIVGQFRKQAALNPDNTAVLDKNSQLTYKEFDLASNALAHSLMEEGIKAGDHVCVALPRRKEFLLAAIGTMKAGAAYVPIETDYPEERRLFIMKDSEAKAIIDEEWLKKHTCGDISAVDLSDKDATAYMIYTSGSSGKPKGVMVPHRALSHFIQFIVKEWRLSEKSRINCDISFCFDASIEDLFSALTVGGVTCIVPEEATKDLELLHQFITDHGITGGNYTTQIGQLLLQEYPDLPVDYINIGGERMTVNPPCRCRLINTYGPTEFTVDCTWYELEHGRQYDNIPIGRPLYNLSAYIIDGNKHLLPRGMAGELCMSGPQMATGYWKREELTAKSFSSIIVDGKEVSVYRTGDLCRWNEEGQLEYLGRIDTQVKLRGFRIELGEIESQAAKFDGIRQAVANVREGQQLCLYYTSDNDISEDALREFLSQSLPEYMVPIAYIRLERIPLTPNGKVDRKRLPELDGAQQLSDIHHVSPANKMEKTLLEIAYDILGRDDFGVTDNLEQLGMNSIQAMRIATRAWKEGYTIRVAELLRCQRIRDLHADGISLSRWLNAQDKEKPIVVYTLGISGESNSSYLIDALQEKFRVCLFEDLTEIYTSLSGKNIDLLVDEYLSILRTELNGEGVHAFIGHSLGGEMTYRLAGKWCQQSGSKAKVVILDYAPWINGDDINSWKILKGRVDDKHLALPGTVKDRLKMAILITDIVIQMSKTSGACPVYDLPVHLFVSTNHSTEDDILYQNRDVLTAEDRPMLHEILKAGDMAEAIDIEKIWHENHKGGLTVNYIADTHNGMLKEEYMDCYMDALTQ